MSTCQHYLVVFFVGDWWLIAFGENYLSVTCMEFFL